VVSQSPCPAPPAKAPKLASSAGTLEASPVSQVVQYASRVPDASEGLCFKAAEDQLGHEYAWGDSAPKVAPIESIIKGIEDGVKGNPWVTKPESVKVYVENIMADHYLLMVETTCKGEYEEAPRSSINITIDKVMAQLQPAKQ